LENALGHACMMAEGNILDVRDFPDRLRAPTPRGSARKMNPYHSRRCNDAMPCVFLNAWGGTRPAPPRSWGSAALHFIASWPKPAPNRADKLPWQTPDNILRNASPFCAWGIAGDERTRFRRQRGWGARAEQPVSLSILLSASGQNRPYLR